MYHYNVTVEFTNNTSSLITNIESPKPIIEYADSLWANPRITFVNPESKMITSVNLNQVTRIIVTKAEGEAV